MAPFLTFLAARRYLIDSSRGPLLHTYDTVRRANDTKNGVYICPQAPVGTPPTREGAWKCETECAVMYLHGYGVDEYIYIDIQFVEM